MSSRDRTAYVLFLAAIIVASTGCTDTTGPSEAPPEPVTMAPVDLAPVYKTNCALPYHNSGDCYQLLVGALAATGAMGARCTAMIGTRSARDVAACITAWATGYAAWTAWGDGRDLHGHRDAFDCFPNCADEPGIGRGGDLWGNTRGRP